MVRDAAATLDGRLVVDARLHVEEFAGVLDAVADRRRSVQ